MKRTLIAALAALVVLTAAVAPAAAAPGDAVAQAGSGGDVDECMNSDKGPSGDGGPPGFVADLTPAFLSDLIGSLPVPGFVKGLFGASTC